MDAISHIMNQAFTLIMICRDIYVQTKYYFFQTIKGAKFLFFSIFYGFSIYFFNRLYRAYAEKNTEIEAMPGYADSSLKNIYYGYIYEIYQGRPKAHQYVLELDPIIVISFTILFFFLPFYMLILGYTSLAEESQRNSVKYLVQYTSRGALFFSKLAALLIASVPVLLGGLVITYFVNVNTLVPVDTRAQIWHLGKYLLLLIPYIVTITSMIFFCSAVSSQTYTALGLGITVWAVLGINQITRFKVVSPFFYENYFFYPEPIFTAFFLGGCLILTTIFLITGYFVFTRKEYR